MTASYIYYQLPAGENAGRSVGEGNIIESERGREADWRRTNQENESRLKKKGKRRQIAKAAQKEQKQRSRKQQFSSKNLTKTVQKEKAEEQSS